LFLFSRPRKVRGSADHHQLFQAHCRRRVRSPARAGVLHGTKQQISGNLPTTPQSDQICGIPAANAGGGDATVHSSPFRRADDVKLC
jgi:hypothetical protein